SREAEDRQARRGGAAAAAPFGEGPAAAVEGKREEEGSPGSRTPVEIRHARRSRGARLRPVGAAGGGRAGSGGNVGVGGATFDQPDFNYSYYVERMLVTIGLNWFKPAESVPISPMIRFRIERDGTISDPQLERSSGLPFVDRAALRAVMASSPLPPLPQEFSGKYLGVHLIFE